MPLGRPSKRSPALAAKICDRLAAGEPLTHICRDPAIPDTTNIFRWLSDDAEFRLAYTRARECCIELMAHQISEIADTPMPGVRIEEKEIGRLCSLCNQPVIWRGRWRHEENGVMCEGAEAIKVMESRTVTADIIEHRKLQVDTRKWLLSKLAPRKYGDRQQIDQRFVDGDGKDRPLTLADIDRMRAEPESDSE